MEPKHIIERAEPVEGVWIDGSLGQYIGQRVIQIAINNGAEYSDLGIKKDKWTSPGSEHYHESWDAAERWMTEHMAPEGYYFGSFVDGGGDWGLLKVEDSDDAA